MRLRSWMTGLAMMGFVLIGAGNAYSQEEKPKGGDKDKPAKGDAEDMGDAEHDKMMEMFEALAKPGPEHENLKYFVGEWKTEVKAWMGPGEPTVSEGAAKFEPVLGGRFIKGTYTGNFMDKPFEGFGLHGYDNGKKQYVGIWCDSMGTGIMTSTGSYDASAKTYTYMDSYEVPGMTIKMKEIIKIAGPDKYSFTMYNIDPDGAEKKEMEITYTRKK